MTACLVVLVMLGCVGPGQVAPQDGAARAPDRWVAEDKLQHFAMSFAATGMSYGAARLALEPGPARGAAAGFALSLGVGKELADRSRGRPFSLKDLAWDVAGVALGVAFARRIH